MARRKGLEPPALPRYPHSGLPETGARQVFHVQSCVPWGRTLVGRCAPNELANDSPRAHRVLRVTPAGCALAAAAERVAGGWHPSRSCALLSRLAGKAGIEKRVHGLCHTHAAELAREGVPMNVIQAQLGHANLGTTSRYLAHIAPAEVIRVMQGRGWEA